MSAQRVAFVGSYTGFAQGQLGWVGTAEPGKGITPFLFDESKGTLTPAGDPIPQVCTVTLLSSCCHDSLYGAAARTLCYVV